MRLVWTDTAKKHLREILSYIRADDPAAARKMKVRIEKSVSYLAHQPFMGRQGALPGTRETIPHPSYRLVYQVLVDEVQIVALVHTARQWPPMTDDD